MKMSSYAICCCVLCSRCPYGIICAADVELKYDWQ